jgi:hypothetical protein
VFVFGKHFQQNLTLNSLIITSISLCIQSATYKVYFLTDFLAIFSFLVPDSNPGALDYESNVSPLAYFFTKANKNRSD